MAAKRVGVRELKANLSSCLRQITAGKTLVITERGKPVGRLSPVEPDLDDVLNEGVRPRLWAWMGKKWKPLPPKVRGRKGPMMSDLLLEDRD